jgi:hypothetical protein
LTALILLPHRFGLSLVAASYTTEEHLYDLLSYRASFWSAADGTAGSLRDIKHSD